MNRLISMLKLQQELNDDTNGKGWESGKTKNDKTIDWRRCIYLETAELIESYPWKHWKNIDTKPDYSNIEIETVDIWHFVMSEALRIYKIEDKGDIESLAMQISTQENYDKFTHTNSSLHKNYYEEITLVEDFIKTLFCNNDIEVLTDKFFAVAMQSGMNLDSLYNLYVGKNILNKFRQDHGYKNGSYIKIWDGKEDNVVMQEILKNEKDTSPAKLYQSLEDVYIKL